MGDTDVTRPDNSTERVEFRQKMLGLQDFIIDRCESAMDKIPLKHYFAPIHETYGCYTYAREIFIPKGTLVIGKIHRHQHLNFIMKGQVSVATEFGKKYFTAPCTFISEVGLKRAVYAEEDTIWTTVHLTQHHGEENLDKIEDEVIAKSYDELGLIDSTEELRGLKGESR
jgi:hypothetical protein